MTNLWKKNHSIQKFYHSQCKTFFYNCCWKNKSASSILYNWQPENVGNLYCWGTYRFISNKISILILASRTASHNRMVFFFCSCYKHSVFVTCYKHTDSQPWHKSFLVSATLPFFTLPMRFFFHASQWCNIVYNIYQAFTFAFFFYIDFFSRFFGWLQDLFYFSSTLFLLFSMRVYSRWCPVQWIAQPCHLLLPALVTEVWALHKLSFLGDSHFWFLVELLGMRIHYLCSDVHLICSFTSLASCVFWTFVTTVSI